MTFPTVIAETGGHIDSNANPGVIGIPDGSNVSGRLIVSCITSDGVGHTFTIPTGWTRIMSEGGTGITNVVIYHVTDGTEGYPGTGATINITLDTGVEQWSWASYLISGFHASTAPAAATATTGTSTSPDPGALNPANWDVEDTLWIAFASANGASSTTPRFTGYPTNYTNTRTDISPGGNGCVQASARRQNAVASEDPSAFTLDTSVAWRATTIGVRPAAAATLAPPPFQRRNLISWRFIR